jgi:hypothetical protein
MLFDLGADYKNIQIDMTRMLFPLDIIFINSTQGVVGVLHNVQPGETDVRLENEQLPGARCFLEVNAGEAEGIEDGDNVDIQGYIQPAQFDIISTLVNYMFYLIFIVMMFKVVDKALEEPKELPKLPPLKPPPGYVPIGTPRKAPATAEEEELQKRKLALESKGKEIAKEAGVEFLRLEEGWQPRYATVRYWFKDSKGREIIATDLEELKWKLSLLPKTEKTPTAKWYEKGVEAGRTETWMDVENTVKETARDHPEIKDFRDLVWTDIDLWEQTDHFNIRYGSKMWEDAPGDIDLYSELKDAFWQGYLTGRQEIGRNVFEAARQALKALTTDRRIPFLPQVKGKRGTALYRVNLAAPEHIEEVVLENGTALLKRYNRPVCRFKPTEEQKRRIKKGEGSLVIFDWQEIEWLGTSYWPETKGKVVFIGSCKVSEGLCLTHGYSVSKTVRCPKSPLTDEEWKAAWGLAETAFPEGMSNPWVNGWWPETLEEAEKAVRQYSDALWDAYRKYEFVQRRAIENYARSRDKAIYYYRWYVMQEYERGKELAKKPREKALVGSPAVIPAEKRPRRGDDLEYLADSPEFLTQTIEAIGYRDKLDSTFQEAIARAKGLK